MLEYRWRVEKLNRSLSGFAGDWDALNRRVLAGHPMMDSRYVDTLLWHFGEGSEWICRCEKDGTTAGLIIMKPARPGVWSSFIPAQSPGFPLGPMILEEASALARLIPALPGWAGQVDLLCQDALINPGFQCRETPCRPLPYALTMSIRLEGGFESYWQQRSSNLRGAVRQRMNRLAKAGWQPRLVRLEAPGDMAAAVRRYACLELTGWKGREGSAVSPDNAKGRFYTEILEKFAETGQAAVYEYWLGDCHVASQMIIHSERMAIYLKTTYDEKFAEFSPGLLLLQELVRDNFSRLPGGVFEFYTNTHSSPMQLAWATDQRWIEHLTLYRNEAVRRALSAIVAARDQALSLRDRARNLCARPGTPPNPGSNPAA